MVEDDDPFGSYGLKRIALADKALFDAFFSTCPGRLSDYTFANTFIWRDSIHLSWRVLHDCLCVFANGDGGLTMLFPPLGHGDATAALRDALDICDQYNAAARRPRWTRVEYVSRELMERLQAGMTVAPMSGDYVYATARMIDLAGGELASKRQARNRFARRYVARTEDLAPRHIEPCLDLLATWQEHAQDHNDTGTVACFKRSKEVAAAADALYNAPALGLRGMVLYADDKLIGFTLGEMLDGDTCSIVIEKTDRQYVGSAQYIFSEFCRQYWAHTTWCNVGDDWEIPTLAWTKQSYRPARRLDKFVIRPMRPAMLTAGADLSPAAHAAAQAELTAAANRVPAAAELPGNVSMEMIGQCCPTGLPDLALAGLSDLDDLEALENRSFSRSVALKRRQLRYLLRSPRVTAHVLRQDGHVVASAMLLRRRTRSGVSGRLYSIAVDDCCRGKGYGRALLMNCLDVLRKEGLAGMVLEVAVKNQPAISLYESAGFVKTARLHDYYSPGKDAWKMRLTFRNPAPAATPVLAQHMQ